MEHLIKISIVIPVFNVEAYIDQCIRSVIDIEIPNIEVLIINDGSKDNSINLIQTIILDKSNYRIIHQENKGLSGARNTGIQNSKGEYILFLDSDDWISGNLELLYNTAKLSDADILALNYVDVYESSMQEYKKRELPFNIMKGNDFIHCAMKKRLMKDMAWLNMYKTSFLKKNNLFFCEGILHEDMEFTPRAFIKAESVVYLNIPFYFYRRRANTISSTKSEKRINDLFHIIENLRNYPVETKSKIIIYNQITFIISKIVVLCAVFNMPLKSLTHIKKNIRQPFIKQSILKSDVIYYKISGILIYYLFNLYYISYKKMIQLR